MSSRPLLECRAISKRFGGETALERVDFSLMAGEAHGLVGSNGAGKSTLMRILAGALPDHEGEVLLDGQSVRLASPREAARLGIAMVYQELSGIGQLSVAENLFLGRQPTTRLGRIDWKAMYRSARAQLDELQLDVSVHQRLDTCPLVVRQMVEIARVLHSGARILILDEPTSALSPPETRRLFQLLRQLRERGVAMVFISHFLEDVLEICDRVTVLRDGHRVATRPAREMTKHEIIHAMLGRTVEMEETGYEQTVRLPPRRTEPVVLRVRELARAKSFQPVSFEIAAGECLALYGFVGAGHQELAHAVAGALHVDTGELLVDDKKLPLGSVPAAVENGVVMVAADRGKTLVGRAPIYQNTTLAHLRSAAGRWLRSSREVRAAEPVLRRVGLQPLAPRLPVRSLSGGNQQKVVMAKWLLGKMRVLVLEEPTRGMDVGAKEEILSIVRQLQAEGVAVLLATTEPELALNCAQRILVFHRGRVTAEFHDVALDRAELMRHA